MTSRRHFTQQLAALGGLAALGLPLGARAQAPLATAKILCGFPAGGTSDAFSRRVGQKLTGYANTVIVENKPGAGGQIAVTTLKDSPADGSVMLLTPASMLTIYSSTYSKLPYKLDDVAPVSMGCYFAHALCVGPAVPESVKNVKDFLAWCKANPDKANYGSPAAGSMPHLLAALLAKQTGTDLKHVPYRGSAPGMQDLIGGQISSMSSPVGDALQHLKGGKARAIAVSGTQRNPFIPDVPTYREQGYPSLTMREWYAFFMPAKTDPAIIRRANAAFQPALADKEVINSMNLLGMEPQHSTPEQLAATLKADADEWRKVVKEIGFSADT